MADTKRKRVLTPEQAEASLAQKRAYYAQNKEKMRVAQKEWKKNNPEKVKELAAAYRERNKEAINKRAATSRAKKPKVAPTEEVRSKVREKYHSNPELAERIKERARAYYAANKEKAREAQKQLYLRTREERLEKQRAYGKIYLEKKKQSDPTHNSRKQRRLRSQNIERYRERERLYRKSPQHRAYVERSRERQNEYRRKRYHGSAEIRAYYASLQRRKKGHPIAVAKWKACSGKCYICGFGLLVEEIAVDHVIPRAKGGTNDPWNLMPVHKSCNSKKRDRLDYPIVLPHLVAELAHIGIDDVREEA